MSKVLAFYPALVSLTGDHASAAVLSQVIYWHRGRLRVKRNGLYWLAKSREEMCAETAITLDQYKRIIPMLVEQGWIRLERHLFNGQVTPFIQLTVKGVKTANQLGVKPTIRLEAYATNQLVSNATNDHTESTSEKTTESTALASDDARSKDFMKSSGKDREGKKEKETVHNTEEDHSARKMRAKDILAAHTTGTGTNLAAFWKSRCALVKTGFQQNLTGKEHGQLKQLQTALGHQTRDVITYTIEHWMKFASRAGASAGTAFPTDPHIGFLLKHHGVAVDLFLVSQQSASTLTLPPPADPVQLIATGAEPEEPVKQLTPDELTALLNGLTDP